MTATASRIEEPRNLGKFLASRPLNFDTTIGSSEELERKVQWRGRLECWPWLVSYRPSPAVEDLLVSTAQPTDASANANEADPLTDRKQNDVRDEILKELRGLQIRHQLHVGNEEQSRVTAALDDAMVVMQAWPSDVAMPILDFDDDGLVSLEVQSDAGFAIAVLDFLGEGHLAACSIVSDSKIKVARRVDTTSTTELILFFKELLSLGE
jgi:hypothetical protein